MTTPVGYMPATRHPWPCLLFIFPLIVIYEAGVLTLGGRNPETIRNGADHWIRSAFGLGSKLFWLPPALLVIGLVLWTCYRWSDRPRDLMGTLTGMMIESIGFSLGLWSLSRILAPLLLQAGIELSIPAEADPDFASPTLAAAEPAMRQVVTYLGAGIYEETVFRLMLFTGIILILRAMEFSGLMAVILAAMASAVVFSLAHHVGPYGQEYSNYLFLFRVAAGLYFAILYQVRGFGVAVGTHACYNVMVSVV
jgi:hypothetical protein